MSGAEHPGTDGRRTVVGRCLRLGWFPFVLALAAAAALAFFLHTVLDQAITERTERDLALALERAAPEFEGTASGASGAAAAGPLVQALARQFEGRATLMDATGRVLADSAVAPERIASVENHLNRPEVAAARASGSGFDRRTSATVSEPFVYVARRLGPAGSPAGYLRLAVPEATLAGAEAPFRHRTNGVSLLFGALVFAVLAAARVRHASEQARVARAVAEAAEGSRPEVPPGTSEATADVYAALSRFASLARKEREGSQRAAILARAVFDQVPAGLVVVDPHLKVLEANPAFALLAGIPDASSAAGKHLLEAVRSRDLLSAFQAGLAGEKVEGLVVRLEGSPGVERLAEVSLQLLPHGGRTGEAAAVGVVFDVTAREKVEALRRRFVADVSHELRTPIAAMRVAAETLAMEELPSPDQRALVAVAVRQAGQMQALVSDLMDLSLIEAGGIEFERGSVDVRTLFSSVSEDLAAAAAARSVSVRIDAPEGLAVSGDRRRLAQVVRNLLDNAVKYSPDGGEVLLEGRAGPGEGSGRRVLLRVVDHGIGIPKQAHEGIFQRFYRVDASRSKSVPGTGLGLAIVKHLVLLHGGTVSVESEPGQGSAFTVFLPAA